ncbi:hypothetical protein TM239_15220 [Bradyrhizobium sp. TM239]|nr:hypothetical protein TM239_15220 [Bradyrhizobium sp. TM239]
MPLLPVEGAVDDIAGVRQCLGELAIEIGVVLNNEQAHAFSPDIGRINTTPDEQFRRELNMNAGNCLRYFLVIYDVSAANATAPAMRPDEPAAWRAQCAAFRGRSEGPPFP